MASSNLMLTLDMNDWNEGGKKREHFLKLRKSSLLGSSFAFVKNHGIPEELLDELKFLMNQYFDLPKSRRMKYCFPKLGRQVGYSEFAKEKGDGAQNPDNKHFWQMGDLHDFLYINEVPGLRDCMVEYFNIMRALYQTLTRSTSLVLGQEEEFLLKKEGNNTLRLIDYPERKIIVRSEHQKAILGGNAAGYCAFPHYDINVETLLTRVEKGLQLWSGRNGWFEVPVRPDCIVVNAGLMLQHISNGLIKAGKHRVVCEAGVRRFASPLFGHVMPRAYINPLPEVNGEPDYKNYPYTFSHDYLMHVLVKIKLLKKPIPIEKAAGGMIIIEPGDICKGAIYRNAV